MTPQAVSSDSRKQFNGDVDTIVSRARIAQAKFADNADQARYDDAALAAAWALMEPERNSFLAKMAVKTTGLGNVKDKITKNHRKTLGLLRDIKKSKTCGIISDDAKTGITKIARPVGVVGAVVPSTNPVATPTNNVINALKCGNAIILSPSPKGAEVCGKLVGFIHDEFDKIGVDRDLVQMLDAPVSKIKAQRLMEQCDILVVTGSQNNVHRAYSSGTPAIGVGAGNVAVIVDETADIGDAARKVAASKSFDNSTSCSSENVLIVVKSVYEEFTALIADQGGILLGEEDRKKLHVALFVEGHLNRAMLAKNVDEVIANASLELDNSDSARFLVIEGKGVGPLYPESGEKLSLVLTLYCASDYAHAKEIALQVMDYQGAGHSVGLHTSIDSRAVELGHQMPTCRVIVNQAHCFATGGSFDNGMPFSLSMGCGSWGGNSIDDNFNHKHLMNIAKVIRAIAPDEPALGSIFDEYWAKAGK